MSFASDSGYIPVTIQDLMNIVMANVNVQFGTNYTTETFVGTNYYKYFYALMQRAQANEIKTSEIFVQMQEYFITTNEKVLRPNTTHPGIIDYFASFGFLASTKPPIDADAGKLYICIDVDSGAPNYAATKLQLCKYVKDCCVGGVVSQGTQVSSITLDNGQSFDFKYNLPNLIPVKLRLTVTQSENNLFAISTPAVVAQKLFDQVNASYRLGKNFEPQRYFSVPDAPWAESVLLEYSQDGGSTWASIVYDADYDDLFTFALSDISVVEA